MNTKGYTIIELLMALTAIGLISTATIPAFKAVDDEARYLKAKAEVKTIQTIVERFSSEYKQFPQKLDMSTLSKKNSLIEDKLIDPFSNASYNLEKGYTKTGKTYYVIFSKGRNGAEDFYVYDDRIYLNGDDVIASNLPVIRAASK